MNSQRLKETYEKYHKKIFFLCLHYTRNTQDAEDITQEVFVRLARSQIKGTTHNQVRAWLYRVAINLCLDYKSFTKRSLKKLYSLFLQERKNTVNIENKIILIDEINMLLKQLDHRSRMVIILKYMEEMEYSEISELMNIPVNTLKSIAARAIRKIQKP